MILQIRHFILVVALMLSACQRNDSVSRLYKFDDYQLVKIMLNVDYKLTRDGGPTVEVGTQNFYLNAYLFDGHSTQIAVGRVGETPVMDLPVSLDQAHLQFEAIAAIPSSAKAVEGGYTIHFSLKEVKTTLFSSETIDSVKNLDALKEGIQPGLEGSANPVYLSLATTIAYQIAKESGALASIASGAKSFVSILDLVSEQTTSIENTVDPSKTPSLSTFAEAIKAAVKLSFANDQSLQTKVAQIVQENAGENESFAENFTEVLKNFVVNAKTTLGENKDTAAAQIFTTESITGISIPDPDTYTGVIYAPAGVVFTDTDMTITLGGSITITPPSVENGIESYGVYFGGDHVNNGKLKLVGSVAKGQKPLSVNLDAGSSLPNGATRFWVFPVTKKGELALGTSTLIVNINKPAGLTYTTPAATYTAGSLITQNVAISTGGTITSYSVSPALPVGLSMDAATGTITGRPTTSQGATNYTVTGSNASGSTTTVISITVSSAAPAAVSLAAPSAVLSGDSFVLSGTCSGELGTITVDIGNDSTPTAGVSTDPLSCTCENSVFTCPVVTITHPQFTLQTVSYKTSISSSWAGSAHQTSNNATALVHLSLTGRPVVGIGLTLKPEGSCSPNSATVTLTAPAGFTPPSISCACTAGGLAACGDFTESTAAHDTPLTLSASITSDGKTKTATRTLSVGNQPPIALSGASGAGNAYQSGQLGGLSFTRYGHGKPTQVSHDEMMDFIDDPMGHADGQRADGSDARQAYEWAGTSELGWTVSALETNDKYADEHNEIIPVEGDDYFGDTYRGYFVPPQNGVYKFVAEIPDNAVRLMMSPNECPQNAIAIVSADLAHNMGAVDPASIWINGNGGAYEGTQRYNHNTAVFFPNGQIDTEYGHGTVYLLANKIYYLEIRYAEGGGGNSFSFGMDRRDFESSTWDGVANLKANTMLPYSGADQYVPRQACGGSSYNASLLFTDPESDAMEYKVRLVNSDGSEISGAGSDVSSVGLSFDTTTGVLSGTANGNYTTQKLVFSARDPGGSNLWTDSSAIILVQ